jgi:uncharacterized protein (DUF1697 family)
MTTYVALLRAINVGGTGSLPMKALAALCGDCGLENARTYIQSGNVVFDSALSESAVVSKLGKALAGHMGKPIDVMVRTGKQVRAILDANPFPDAEPAKIAVIFLTKPLPKGLLDGLVIPGREKIEPTHREIYIHYPDGMGRSKLKLPRTLVGTARNINTVAKLAELANA